MRSLFATVVVIVIAHSDALAQRRDARFDVASTHSPALSLTVQGGSASTGRLVAGGLLGGAVGLVAGGFLGAVIGNDEEDTENGWLDALYGSVIGGAIGESLGLAAGVHIGNRRQGNLLMSSAASLALGAIGATLVWKNQDPPASPIILTLTPLVQLITTITIERRGN